MVWKVTTMFAYQFAGQRLKLKVSVIVTLDEGIVVIRGDRLL